MQFLQVCRAGPPSFALSLRHDLFMQTFPHFPYQKFMALYMSYIYPSYVATTAMTANVKCIVTWQYNTKKRKKNLFGPFLWMQVNCLKAKATMRRQFTFYH